MHIRHIRHIAAKLGPLVTAACLLTTMPAGAAPLEQNDNSTTLGGLKEHTLPPEEKAAPAIEVKQAEPAVPIQQTGEKIQVQKIHIIGQNLYGDEVLQPLVQEAVGKELTLGELEGVARRLTQYFHDQGYLVARAFLPAQTIENGVVEITVLVGQYGQIQVQNHSTLHASAVNRVLQPLKSGDYISQATLERVLLLLSDTDGITSKATLTAGAAPGTSDLIVDIANTVKTSGQTYIDNHGSRYTGKNRFGLNWNVHNLSGQGDSLALGLLFGKDSDDYSLAYQLPTGGQGAQLGVSYSRQHYSLGEDFASLDASGVAKTTSIYESYPFVRSRNFNLTGRIGFDHKELEDRIDYVSSNSRKKNNIWNIGLSGDSRDNWGGGGYTSFGLNFASGHLRMESADALTGDSSANTAGHYNKANLNLYRVQSINDRLNLHLSFASQWANQNLDSSEKLSLGGPSGVRAYPVNEASGDQGFVTTGELRWNLPDPKLQLAGFIDHGHITVNKNPWDSSYDNGRTLTGAGLGLILSRPGDYALRMDYAWKLSSSDATSDTDHAGRFWLQAVKYF